MVYLKNNKAVKLMGENEQGYKYLVIFIDILGTIGGECEL